jgi:large subunit ribosomal protein L10
MAKTKVKKAEIINEAADKIARSKSVVVVDYTGLKVVDSEGLRRACRQQNVEFFALKKTLLQKAFEKAQIPAADLPYNGSLALVFGFDDEVLPAKLVHTLAKGNEHLRFEGGILNGVLVNAEMVKSLALLPSKQELLGKLVGTIAAPMSGFVNVLAGNLRGLVQVIKSYSESKA